VLEETGVGRGGDERAEIQAGTQQTRRRTHPGRIGLLVKGGLVGQAIEPLRKPREYADERQRPDRGL
jgi:hypothetical protein